MDSTGASTDTSTETPGVGTIDMKLEVVTLPVSDVDRAKRFYESLGWRLDADLSGGDDFRALQFTPPHSQCSIHFGKGVTAAEPGSADRLILAVKDINAARDDLLSRGVDVSEVYESRPPGFESIEGRSYFTYASFSDPDGNGWLLQEIDDPAPRAGMGRVTWTSPRWQICCTRRPSITARSRRRRRSTTGGTGTRHTWTLARAGAVRTRPRRPPRGTWRTSST